jgi:outer membrane protein
MTILPVLVLLAVAADPEPLDVTLEDCIRFALQHNLPLQGSRLDAAAAEEAFRSTWGPFDTVYFADLTGSRRTTAPTPSNFVGGVDVGGSPSVESDFLQLVTGFRGQWTTGTLWSFDIGPRGSETQTAGSESEVFTGVWSLALTQPILRNGADGFPMTGLELARHDATIAALNAEGIANDTLQQVTTAYWNLVFARQNLITRETSVQLASELVDITRRKFEQGLQNRINVTEVEAELATRREELLTARNLVQTTQDELRRLVFAPEDRTAWERDLRPLTAPSPARAVEIDVDDAIDTAMLYRSDVAAAHQGLDRAEVEVRRALNQSRPRFDVTGSYGLNANQADYGSVFSALDDTSFNELRITLGFEVSLANRGAGYDLRRAQVVRQRAGVDLRDAELTTIAEVRAAVREVLLQIERVAATAETTRLNREVYEGEVRRLENDLSTPFQVRQTQRDLLTAVDNETRAQLDLEVARAALLGAQGRLIYAYGLERTVPELSLEDKPPAP